VLSSNYPVILAQLLPRMSKLIEGCAYNPEANLMAFRFNDMAVTVESRQINIFNVEDEAKVKTLMDWLVNIINGTDKNNLIIDVN